MKTEKMSDVTRKELSWFQKISYGTGNFAANMMNNTVGAFISYFYTDVAGLPIAAVGVILLLCRLLDGVSDLTMGVVVENTHTKYGKARPWLLRLAIPYGICIFLMFFSPAWGMTGKIIYAAATYMAGVALVYTAISVPYNTLSALITNDQNERTDLATMRQLFGFVGPLFVSTLTMPIVNALGDTQMAWSVVTAIYGILGAGLYLLVFFTSKEIDTANVESVQKKQSFSMKETLLSIKELLKNQYWLMVLGITLLIFISYGVGGGVQVYYCKYILGNSNYQSALSIAGQIPNIVLCFIIPALAQKFGKRNVSLAGCFIAALGALLIAVNPTSLGVVIGSTAIRTIGLAPISICVFAMLGDTAVYGEWKSGKKNDGVVFAATTFSEKVGYALGGGITSFIMALGGFVANAAAQSAAAETTMKFCMIFLPVIIIVLIMVLLKMYKLDDQYPTIIKELDARKHSA